MTKILYIKAFIVKGLSVAFLFGGQIVLARTASSSADFGYYNYLISILNLVSFSCIWGVDKYLIREVSVYTNANKYESAWKVIRAAYRLVTQNALIAGLPLMCCLWVVRSDRASAEGLILVWALLVAIVLARTSAGVARGLNQVVFAEGALNLFRPLTLLVMVSIVWVYVGELNAEAMLFAATSSYIASELLLRRSNRRNLPPQEAADRSPLRPLYYYCFPYLVIGLGIPLLSNLDVILLGTLSADHEVAIYAACVRVINLAIIGLVSVNLLIAPRIPVLFHENKIIELQVMISSNNKIMLLITLVPTIVILLYGGWVLSAFGEQYVEGEKVLWILLIGQMVNVFVGPVNLICMMTKQQRVASILLLLACGLEALLCYILIPSKGAVGAAWANAVSLSFMNISMAALVIWKVKIDPTLINLFKRD